MSEYHIPVLLHEVLENLRIQKGEKYIDATLGGGGHGVEILKKGGVLLGIDVDEEALEFVKRKWKIEARKWKIREENLTLNRGNFRDIDKIARSQGFEKVQAILFDLGVSSHQLDDPKRGFSFQKEGPLDMRMDQRLGVTAKDLLYALSKKELYDLIITLGEEYNASAISRRIVKSRGVKEIKTTEDLRQLIETDFRKVAGKIHPATRVFQALRIAVNDELQTTEVGLSKAVELLKTDGRLAVISFHSLEDRIVKNSFIDFEKKGLGVIITDKPISPTIEEIRKNKRARSAKLRVFEKK